MAKIISLGSQKFRSYHWAQLPTVASRHKRFWFPSRQSDRSDIVLYSGYKLTFFQTRVIRGIHDTWALPCITDNGHDNTERSPTDHLHSTRTTHSALCVDYRRRFVDNEIDIPSLISPRGLEPDMCLHFFF